MNSSFDIAIDFLRLVNDEDLEKAYKEFIKVINNKIERELTKSKLVNIYINLSNYFLTEPNTEAKIEQVNYICEMKFLE